MTLAELMARFGLAFTRTSDLVMKGELEDEAGRYLELLDLL